MHIILTLINQRLSARLAMVTGKHLAELCYENLHPVNFPFRLVLEFQLLKTYPLHIFLDSQLHPLDHGGDCHHWK